MCGIYSTSILYKQVINNYLPQILYFIIIIHHYVTGRFAEAAKLYKKSGNQQKAMNMYTDLRMFDMAKVC